MEGSAANEKDEAALCAGREGADGEGTRSTCAAW